MQQSVGLGLVRVRLGLQHTPSICTTFKNLIKYVISIELRAINGSKRNSVFCLY
jgi:hypothetical protein